jgi:hypothetical protein
MHGDKEDAVKLFDRLMCLWGKHQWVPITHPRLMILDESWPPNMCDGLPFGGKRFDCAVCKKMKWVPGAAA